MMQGSVFLVKGQAFDSLAVDGHLYVKIFDSSQVQYLEYNGNDSVLNIDILNVKNAFGVSKIRKPFLDSMFHKTYEIEFTIDSLINDFITYLEQLPYVEFASNKPIVFCLLTPNDPIVNTSNVTSMNWHIKKIFSEQAWDLSTSLNTVRIAVIDNEIDINHPELINKIVAPIDLADNDFDPSPNIVLNHGTHVAGIAAAEPNNLTGTSGIGFNASIIPIKAATSNLASSPLQLNLTACINGITHAISNQADIINCSWGTMVNNQLLQLAVQNAVNNNVVVVAAAGNNGAIFTPNNPPPQMFPAQYSTTINGVISVAATDYTDTKTNFSFFGNNVDICAPGLNIYSSVSLLQNTPYNGYDYMSGTSMAAPIISGLCALIKSTNNLLTPAQIKNCITSTADNIDIQNPNFQGLLGSGRINTFAAVLCALGINSVYFTANSLVACPGQAITFTAFPQNATNFQWTFSPTPSTIFQNNNIVTVTFNTAGSVNVSLQAMVNNQLLIYTQNNYLNIASPQIDFTPRATGTICDGSAQQVMLNISNATLPLTYEMVNCTIPPQPGTNNHCIITLTNDYTNDFFYTADINNTNHIFIISDVNGCNAQIIYSPTIVNCCTNLISGGDFEYGNNTNPNMLPFQSENIFISCNPSATNNSIYGAYQISDRTPPFILGTCNTSLLGTFSSNINWQTGFPSNYDRYNHFRNAFLQIDGRSGVNQVPVGVTPTNPLPFLTGGFNSFQNGFQSILFSKSNIPIVSNQIYLFDYFISVLSGSGLFPVVIRYQITEQANPTNILFSQDIQLPETNRWNQHSFVWNSANFTGNVTVSISQLHYFAAASYDFCIDDISLRTIGLAINATAAPSAICPGQSSVLTASGATNYTWQPGGMAGASITVSPSATTTYTVTGTTANCSATTIITVTVLPPTATACVCPNMPAQTFINPLASDLLSFYGNPPNNTIFGQTLGIDGTLLVDVDITFVNSHLLMAPDALISYSNPVLLTFDDNTIVETPPACPMWKGIEQNMPSSSLHSLSSTFRDMKDGIITTGSAINSPQLLLESSHFENNYFSVQLQSLNANNVTIVGNQFQTTSPFLKSPYSLYPRGEQGIRILDCATMNIGNTVTDGNHFENLFTGIYIKQFLTISSSQINIHYNKFHNIHGGTTLWPSPLNIPGLFVENDTRGCAIFGENNNSSHVVQFSCLGFNSSPLWDFSNCQKGILVKGFRNSIHFNRMNEVDGAVLLYKCEGNSHSVTYNTLENTYLGIGAWGNMGGGGIMHNAISVIAYPFVVNPNYGSQFWGKGIELGYFSNSSPGNMAANHNTISSTEPEWIIGLNVYNSPYGPRLSNTISFTSSSTALNTSFTFPALRGISLINSINNQFVNNTLNGTYQASNTNRRSTGFWLHRSPRNYFSCNTMDQTRYGMYVVGNNATGNPYAVVGNRHNPTFSGQATHYLAWVFRHLGTEATFGNIGDLQHDNHNTFGPLSAYTGGFKVYKFCNAFQNDFIYTNPLTLSQAESGSNNGCGYIPALNDPAHNQYDCATGSFVPVKKFTLAEAMDIAQDSVVYPEYQPIARWMDENDLYHQLCHDTAMRYSSPILLQFYTSQHADATRYIAETNELIETLSQDVTGMSLQDYQDLLADAEARNAEIQSPDVQEQNEHDINRIYLHYLRHGSDSISPADAILIEDLAIQCPYIAGTAVYKARSLYALYRPGFYIDDMALCNTAGVYKNGKGLFDDENDVLENLQGNAPGIALEQDVLWVYPNPTQGSVNIASQYAFSQASWILKDMAGRSIAQGTLSEKVYSQAIELPPVASGIYQLQVMTGGKLYVNKLTIE